MPELPEVQTVVSDLNKNVLGEKIVGFASVWKRKVQPSFSVFKNGVNEAKILNTRRIGKHIILDLDNDCSVVIHLKMTGHLLFKPYSGKVTIEFDEKVNGYIRHSFKFKSGSVLDFSDMRKFGWVRLVKTEDVENIKEIKSLGIDAVSKEFTLKVFNEILERRQKSIIGVVLLDQSFIAGIGNIYRSEILFLAGVNPKRIVATLKPIEVEKIFKEIKNVLGMAIKMRGTSDVDYRDIAGKKGNFQNVLKVYKREGELCKNCDGMVVREKLGQRSFFYCPKCQK